MKAGYAFAVFCVHMERRGSTDFCKSLAACSTDQLPFSELQNSAGSLLNKDPRDRAAKIRQCVELACLGRLQVTDSTVHGVHGELLNLALHMQPMLRPAEARPRTLANGDRRSHARQGRKLFRQDRLFHKLKPPPRTLPGQCSVKVPAPYHTHEHRQVQSPHEPSHTPGSREEERRVQMHSAARGRGSRRVSLRAVLLCSDVPQTVHLYQNT